MTLVETLNRARHLAGMSPLSESQAATLSEGNGCYVVAKVGFTSTKNDKDKEASAEIAIKCADNKVKDLMDHLPDVDWDESGLEMDHVVQNTTGGHYVPGSAHFISAKKTDSAPAKSFTGNAGDILAA